MWLQDAIRWLLPNEDRFWDFVEAASVSTHQCAVEFLAVVDAPDKEARTTGIQRVRDHERGADKAFRDMMDALDGTFVTPIDREDLFRLTNVIEDVSDFISAVASRLDVYRIDVMPAGARELSVVLVRATDELRQASHLLRDPKKADEVQARCQAIRELEREGDTIFRTRVGDLFDQETNAITLVKSKECLEALENAVDKAKEAAEIIASIVIKHG